MTVNWSRIIGNVGRSLIMSGVLVLLFVVYQLWGTAIREQRAQNALRSEFETEIEQSIPELAQQFDLDAKELPSRIEPEAVVVASSTDETTDEALETASRRIVDTSSLVIDPTFVDYGPPPPPPEDGSAIARIRIPAIDVDKVVIEGVGTNALKDGPGHYPETPLPGQPGNAAIAGHRTTYGAPFGDLDKLVENDLIYVTTAQGAFQYVVVESMIVSPRDVWVLDPTEDDRLTLTTCHPRFSARERLVVVAELIGPAAEAAPPAVDGSGAAVGRGQSIPGEDVGDAIPTDEPISITTTSLPIAPPTTLADETGPTTTVGAALDDIEVDLGATAADEGGSPQSFGAGHGFDGERAATWPAIFWALAAVFVWTLFWYLSHNWKRWPAYLLGAPVFLVVLFMFFENFSRLLPSAA